MLYNAIIRNQNLVFILSPCLFSIESCRIPRGFQGKGDGMKESFLEYHYSYLRPETEWLFVTPSLDSRDLNIQVQELGHFIYDGESYTLRGTRLPAQTRLDPATGYWANDPYGWGYADNVGSDDLGGADAATGDGQCCGFRIANAIRPDGTPIELQYIDFVKVQVGVNAKSGPLGEVSTEVFSFRDLSM